MQVLGRVSEWVTVFAVLVVHGGCVGSADGWARPMVVFGGCVGLAVGILTVRIHLCPLSDHAHHGRQNFGNMHASCKYACFDSNNNWVL